MQALIVEDSEYLAFLWQETLADMGFNTVVEHSRKGAAKRIEEQDFDFVLLDFYVDDGTTEDFAAWVKIRSPEVPVLMLTGSNIYPNGEHTNFAAGVDWFLRKPIAATDLRAIVDYLTGNRAYSTQLSEKPKVLDQTRPIATLT